MIFSRNIKTENQETEDEHILEYPTEKGDWVVDFVVRNVQNIL